MLFDNSLNDKRFRIDIRTENGYEEGCTRGARYSQSHPNRVAFLYWTYIVKSETSGRYYCGSSDDVARRVLQHNDPDYTTTKTTKRLEGPWRLVWSEGFGSRAEAMTRERQIKKRGIGRFLAEQQRLSRSESREARD